MFIWKLGLILVVFSSLLVIGCERTEGGKFVEGSVSSIEFVGKDANMVVRFEDGRVVRFYGGRNSQVVNVNQCQRFWYRERTYNSRDYFFALKSVTDCSAIAASQ